MKEKVRFLHTADIHLGSTVHAAGKPPDKLKELFNSVVCNSFKRICDTAIEYEVDFIIIAGDLYDEKQRSITAINFFKKQCQRLKNKNINIYTIAGNHDPYYEGNEMLSLPDNVYLFDSEDVEIREINDRKGRVLARILGQSYRGIADSRKMYSFYTAPDKGVWNIGLLHTQLDPQNTKYVPCSEKDLASKKDIDYWGLGHIHQPRFLKEEPVIAYPGIPQGRDIAEAGLGGCLLVDLIPQRSHRIKYIPTSSIVWKKIEISIDKEGEKEPENLEELKELAVNRGEELLGELPDYPEKFEPEVDNRAEFFSGYIVRWVITGRGKIHNKLMKQKGEVVEYLEKELREIFQYRDPFIWTESFVIRTATPLPPLAELKKNSELFSEIEKVSNLCQKEGTIRQELIEKIGDIWVAETDHENYDEGKFQLDKDLLNDIIEQATDQVMTRIWEERGG